MELFRLIYIVALLVVIAVCCISLLDGKKSNGKIFTLIVSIIFAFYTCLFDITAHKYGCFMSVILYLVALQMSDIIINGIKKHYKKYFISTISVVISAIISGIVCGIPFFLDGRERINGETVVYVGYGKDAEVYHKTKSCAEISNKEVEAVLLETAEKDWGCRPCRRCFKIK